VSHNTLASTGDLNENFYVDSGASDHLIPSRGDLHAYRKFEKQDVYYAPGIHARLVSLGKLEGQIWDVRLRDGGMELRNRDGDEGLAERLETVAMVATARGAEGTMATLLTWHRRLGHPSYKDSWS